MLRISLKHGVLLMTIAVILTGTSCKKREAKADLLGDWTVTGYTGFLLNECDDELEYADTEDQVYGSITFEERWMKRTYELKPDTGDCYRFADVDDLVRWKITDYEKRTSAAHFYTLDIDGRSWTLTFGDEGVGEYPEEQDVVYLSHLAEDGNAFAIELTRDQE